MFYVIVYKRKRFITNKIFDIKVYRNPTDNDQYLRRSQFHPPSLFKGFVIGEIIRFIRSSNDEEETESQIKLYREKLQKRDYVADEINPIITMLCTVIYIIILAFIFLGEYFLQI